MATPASKIFCDFKFKTNVPAVRRSYTHSNKYLVIKESRIFQQIALFTHSLHMILQACKLRIVFFALYPHRVAYYANIISITREDHYKLINACRTYHHPYVYT